MGLVSNIKDKDWVSVRQGLAKMGSLKAGPTATPTFAGLTLTGLTANSLIYPNSSKVLTSLGVAANGQLPIGSTGTTPVLATLTGTTNQVNIANAAGSITLSTPQDIHSGASPTFTDLTLSSPSNIYALSHDSFANFVTNKHIDHTAVTLTAGTGLTGGGDISTNRTFAVDGVLEDLDTLGANSADSEFLVGTGAGALAWESGATVRTSIGLGTGDSPTFAGLKIESELFVKEQAAADSDQTGYGQIWVKNDTPNTVYFTNDVGTDYQLGLDVGGGDYVDRGDPAAFDWSVGDFTTDGTWRDLDCSSIVPAGARAILFRLVLYDDVTASYFFLRKNGNSNVDNNAGNRTLVANLHHYADIIVACDSNRIVEYLGANLTFNVIDLVVRGWWIPSDAEVKVKVDSGATADYIGAASNDGVLRTSAPLIYTDGGNFVTLSLDAGLTDLATVAMAADKFYYTSADNTHVAGTITAAGRAILDDANAAAQATTLGLGTGDSPQFTGIELGHANDTTITRASSGVIAVEGTNVMLVGDAATAHAILDGSVHSDSVADAVTRGSIIYGNATPKWDELVIGTGFLRGDGTDCGWLSYANSLAAMSGQAGAAFAWNSQNLTGVGTIGCGAVTGTSTAVFEGASVSIGKASTTTGTVVLYDSNSANTITLTVPDISAGSLTFTLPPTDGDNTNVLQTNGSGVLTWVATTGTDEKVKVDAAATADYLGAASNDGALRASTGLSYTDGGNYVTLGLDVNGLAELAAAPDQVADFVLIYDTDASTHKKIKPTNLGYRYVDRDDASDYDKEVGDFTTDATWNDLDLSAVVPAGAKAIQLLVSIEDDAVESYMFFRKNGSTSDYSVTGNRTQVANVLTTFTIFVACDSNRVIEYKGSNLAFVTINLTVTGWLI